MASVNGTATPAVGDYSMRFNGEGIGARFGCNSLGGRYRIAGDTLIISDLASTAMGCAEPAASFESLGAAVLTRPMRMEFTAGNKLRVANAAGSIMLDSTR